MKICFPTEQNEGIKSKLSAHFGSAAFYIIYDTESGSVTDINNKNKVHSHGACNPLASLQDIALDAIVAGGIGAGALNKLNASGLKVYRAQAETVKENIDLMANKNLSEFLIINTCSGHNHGDKGGCSHI
ncbi:MAG: NifB/NifX family molybdenum-iron cluster-binding protein [Nitrospiraceae bacterium]|nr:NifB/NifX family molybdenum-iron cluster-binding protein [Nitrospiraceae bacterium]